MGTIHNLISAKEAVEHLADKLIVKKLKIRGRNSLTIWSYKYSVAKEWDGVSIPTPRMVKREQERRGLTKLAARNYIINRYENIQNKMAKSDELKYDAFDDLDALVTPTLAEIIAVYDTHKAIFIAEMDL